MLEGPGRHDEIEQELDAFELAPDGVMGPETAHGRSYHASDRRGREAQRRGPVLGLLRPGPIGAGPASGTAAPAGKPA